MPQDLGFNDDWADKVATLSTRIGEDDIDYINPRTRRSSVNTHRLRTSLNITSTLVVG